ELRVDTDDPRLRARFAEAAAEERTQVAHQLASAGVAHVVLSTDRDWLRDLAIFVRRRRRELRVSSRAAGLARDPAARARLPRRRAAPPARGRPLREPGPRPEPRSLRAGLAAVHPLRRR